MRVQTGNNKNALLVPQAAVIEVQSLYQVIVVGADNKATFRPVKVGERVGPNWIITEGLKAGRESGGRRHSEDAAVCCCSCRS